MTTKKTTIKAETETTDKRHKTNLNNLTPNTGESNLIWKTVEKVPWGGLDIPVEIFNVCQMFKNNMVAAGIYSKTMDMQIYNTATIYYLYNRQLCLLLRGGKGKPELREVMQIGEILRKNLRELALTKIGDKNGNATDVSPITELVNIMNSDDDELI